MNADIYANLRLAAWRDALRVLLVQFVVLVTVAVMVAVADSSKAAWSIAVGGGVGMLSTSYMAFALLRSPLDASAKRVAVSFFVGWALKALLTIALLWSVFRSSAFVPWALLVGFAAGFAAYWIVGARRRV